MSKSTKFDNAILEKISKIMKNDPTSNPNSIREQINLNNNSPLGPVSISNYINKIKKDNEASTSSNPNLTGPEHVGTQQNNDTNLTTQSRDSDEEPEFTYGVFVDNPSEENYSWSSTNNSLQAITESEKEQMIAANKAAGEAQETEEKKAEKAQEEKAEEKEEKEAEEAQKAVDDYDPYLSNSSGNPFYNVNPSLSVQYNPNMLFLFEYPPDSDENEIDKYISRFKVVGYVSKNTNKANGKDQYNDFMIEELFLEKSDRGNRLSTEINTDVNYIDFIQNKTLEYANNSENGCVSMAHLLSTVQPYNLSDGEESHYVQEHFSEFNQKILDLLKSFKDIHGHYGGGSGNITIKNKRRKTRKG